MRVGAGVGVGAGAGAGAGGDVPFGHLLRHHLRRVPRGRP